MHQFINSTWITRSEQSFFVCSQLVRHTHVWQSSNVNNKKRIDNEKNCMQINRLTYQNVHRFMNQAFSYGFCGLSSSGVSTFIILNRRKILHTYIFSQILWNRSYETQLDLTLNGWKKKLRSNERKKNTHTKLSTSFWLVVWTNSTEIQNKTKIGVNSKICFYTSTRTREITMHNRMKERKRVRHSGRTLSFFLSVTRLTVMPNFMTSEICLWFCCSNNNLNATLHDEITTRCAICSRLF